MNKRRGRGAGFTLVELMVVIALFWIILVAFIGLFASVVKWHYQDIGRGRSLGAALYGLSRMYQELGEATVLMEPPPPVFTTGNEIWGCKNWSNLADVLLNPGLPIQGFWYCVCTTPQCTSQLPPTRYTLLRFFQNGVCPVPKPACDMAGSYEAVIYQNLSQDGAAPYFTRSASGVDLRFVVGAADPSLTIKAAIAMNKSYTHSPAPSD